MLLSIITINLNNSIGLQQTIDSILMQTYQDFEWIVIDGGSTDGSKELLQKNQDRINYWISEPDKGIYDGMNKGIVQAHGDYLLFLNSGDCFANETVLEFFSTRHDDSDLIVGRSIMEGGEPPKDEEKKDYSIEDEVFFLCTGAYPHQATFIRRSLFDKYGLYREDKRIASDWYHTINAVIKGNARVSHIPILVSIREKDGISSRLSHIMNTERMELIKENPYFSVLFEFFSSNRELLTALKCNRLVFFLFRVYYFFFRKFNNRK
jgi:glycosyltransferase involved in cell wall biosynthesis